LSAVFVTSVKTSVAGFQSCTALLSRSHAMTLPVGSIAMCTAMIGHVNGPDHAPLSCAWLEATVKVVLVEVGPSVAVTFAACGVVTVPAVAVKVADVELAGTEIG